MSKTISRALLFALFTLFYAQLDTAKEPSRPKILGIRSVQVETSDLVTASKIYAVTTGIRYECGFCEKPQPGIFELPSGQFLSLTERKDPTGSSFLKEIQFSTNDLLKLRDYLKSQNVSYREEKLANGYLALLKLTDPEGHEIDFGPQSIPANARDFQLKWIQNSVHAKRIIHAGFVVKDRAAMDHFYKDILGFRLYWQGGMHDGETDWVDMQVPDGTDWIEYMLNVPAGADKHTLGVMNHIALGVPDIHAAQQQLIKNGWKGTEQPKIGRDGKWQLNLYDPDETRVELMEFTPVEKPCCSEYTGPHPKP
jgi:catechol 2,3-dioxygenase-like lactoylglutathione lyase family enzyme